MHEVKLGFKIKDYLTGKEIDATTYEDIRQDIVKTLVEDKSYPMEQIKSKIPIIFKIDQKEFGRNIDFVIFLENKPLVIILFSAGEIETYIREAVSLSRLIEGGPARFSIVTDTKKFILVCAKDGEVISQGPYKNFPTWQGILNLLDRCPEFTLDDIRLEKEKRILYALSQLSCECRDSCLSK